MRCFVQKKSSIMSLYAIVKEGQEIVIMATEEMLKKMFYETTNYLCLVQKKLH